MQLHEANVHGVDLRVRPGTWDERIANEVIRQDCYDCATWLTKGPVTIVDVGGHIGSFSRWMALRMPQARIFTFEMDESNIGVCEQNLALPNVTLMRAALGPRSGRVVRGPVHTDNTGGGHVEWNRHASEEHDSVRAVGIHDFLSDQGIEYIDLLKLDCEGSEFPIIDEMEKLPGGLRKWVGRIHAEIHAKADHPKFSHIMGQMRAAFPIVTVRPTQSEHQHYLTATR